MSKISDPNLAAIASGLSTEGLSVDDAKLIFDLVRLLRAVREFNDISLFAEITSSNGSRVTVRAVGALAISFDLALGAGPTDLRFESVRRDAPKGEVHARAGR